MHRHRLALLALLSRAHPGGVSRDRLIGLLWPERDTASARHLLRQAIHEIRQELGPTAIGGIGDDVRLGETRLAVDNVEFETAIAAGDLEGAVSLYHGPFLDGFFIDDAQPLDEWISAQRAQLAGRYESSLESLAKNADRLDDHASAARWWRVLMTERPTDSRVALHLIDALDAMRDRVTALAVGAEHVAYLQREIGVEPDAEFRARLLRLGVTPRRTAPVLEHATEPKSESAILVSPLPDPPTTAADPVRGHSELRPADADGADLAIDAAPRGAESTPAIPAVVPPVAVAVAVTQDEAMSLSTAPLRSRPRRPQRRHAATFGGVLLLVAAVAWWRGGTTPPATRSVDVVAVLPFAYDGGGDLAYLGVGLPRLLTANLNGAGQLRTIDPIAIARATRDRVPSAGVDVERVALDVANRFGAGLVVTGDVVQSGNRVRITARVLRVSSAEQPNRPVEIVADGTRDHLFELIDDLSARLVAAWGTERGARLTNLAARTTSSLPALRAYLEGEREYSAARYSAAVESFQRAVAADTGFALAYYRLSSALTWTSDPRTLPVTAQARRYIGRLSRRDSLLVEARFANSSGEPVRAEQLYQQLLSDYPDELEGWLQIAEVQFHWSATLGRPLRLAGSSFARALALDSASLPPYVHLARIVAAERDTAQLTRLVSRIVSKTPATSEAADAEALRAFVNGPREAIARASAALIATHGDNVLRALQGIAAVTENFEASLAVAGQLADRDRGTDRGTSAELVVAQIEAARGRWAASSAALDRAAVRMPDAAAQYRAVFAAASFQRRPHQDLNDARATVMRVGGLPFHFPLGSTADSSRAQWLLGPRRAYLVARLALRVGDSTAAAVALRQPIGASPAERATLERAARMAYAEQAWLRGDARRGLVLLGEAPLQLDSLLPRFASYAVADERFVRGSLLAAVRADTAALRWLETFPDASGYDLVYLAPAHLARAQLHERRGERAAAVAEYRRFIRLWKDCDPELRPLVDEALRRVGGAVGRRALRPHEYALHDARTSVRRLRSQPRSRSD